jgi:hypothetical protein
MAVPEKLELEIASLEAEVGAAAFPDTREPMVERARRDAKTVDQRLEGSVQLRAAEAWIRRLSMLKPIKRDNSSLFEKMARGD